MKETKRLYQLLTSFQANVYSFPQAAFIKVNYTYRKLRRFLVCYKKFFDVLTMGI